ncbi:hypothetical protein D9613_007985 [Agrocybe pediades]|uniref:Uncharacterized protein n=1 Tax=Agrocybe pediades TaxID=84607 RepID=A0A8H4VMS6_9AGAR|nr:hypothetical protein D9613_007985 [Agrocybe pediades]
MATRSSPAPSVIITPYRFTSTGFCKPLSPPKSTPLPATTTVIDISRDSGSDSENPPFVPGTHTQTLAGVPESVTCGTSVAQQVQQPRKRSREIRSPGGSPTSAAEYLSSAASTSSFAFPLVPGGDSTASSAKTRPTKTQKVDNSSHVLDMGRREHHQQYQQQQRQRNHHRSSSSSSRPSTCTTSTLPSSSSSFEHSHTSSTPAAPRRLKRENAIIFPNTGSSATSNATATSSSGTRTTAGSSSSSTPTPSTPSASTSTSTYEYSIPSPTWMETYMRSRFGGDSDFLFMDIDTSPCVPQADVEVDVDGDADTEMDVDLDSGSPSSTAATLSYVREQVQHRGRQRNKPTTSRSIPIQLHTMTTCAKARRKIAKERWNAERARVEKVRLEELKRLREREQEEEERLRKEAEEKEREEKEKMEKMREALKDKKEAAKYRDEMMARAARAREERMKQEQQQLQQQEEEDSVFELRSCLPDQIQASTAPRSLRRSYALYGADEFTNALNTPPVRTRTRTRVHSTSSRPRQPSPPPLSTVPITLAARGRQPRAQSSSSPPAERFLYDFLVVAPSPPPPPAVQFQSKRSPLLPDEFRESARHVVPDDMLPESVREWKRMSPRIPSGTVPSSYSTKAVVACERNGVLSLEDENLKAGGSKKKLKVENKKKGISEMRRAAMVWAVESLFGRKEWLRTCMEMEKGKGMLDEQENEDELGGKVPLTKKKPTTTTKKATKPKKTRPEPEALTPLWKCRQIFRVGPRAAFLHDVVEWKMLFAGVDGGGEDREVMERELFGADRSPQEVPTTVGGTSSATGTATTPAGALVCTDVFDATRELEMLVDDIERARDEDELEIDDDEDVEMFEVAEGCGLDLGSGLGLGGAGEGEARNSSDRVELELMLERELGLACEDEMGFGMLGGERDAPGEVDDSFVVVVSSSLPAAVPLLSSDMSSALGPARVSIPVPSTTTTSSTRSASASASSSKLTCYPSPSSLLSISPRSAPAPLSCSPPGKSKAAMPVMTMTAPAWVVVVNDRSGEANIGCEGEVKPYKEVVRGSAGVKSKLEKESNCGSKMKTGGKFGLGLGLGLSFGGGGGGGRVRRPGSAWRATRSEKEDVVFGTTGPGSSAWEMVY